MVWLTYALYRHIHSLTHITQRRVKMCEREKGQTAEELYWTGHHGTQQERTDNVEMREI